LEQRLNLAYRQPMPHATLELPAIRDQHAFNLKRWRELCADPVLAKLEYRIETDRHGHILMTPPPGFDHSGHQSEVVLELARRMPHGKTLVEVPISTSDGVKGADAAWISRKRCARAVKQNVLIIAPEICVEVLSPKNTRAEMMAKKALYFEAGAREVWFCDRKGRMFFYLADAPGESTKASALCPDFPPQLD
jgi:Uma2 family endonuclease